MASAESVSSAAHLQPADGRRLFAFGDAQNLGVAALAELDAVPDVALFFATLGLLAVDDDPGGQAPFVNRGRAGIAGKGGAAGQLIRAGTDGLGPGETPAPVVEVGTDLFGPVQRFDDGLLLVVGAYLEGDGHAAGADEVDGGSAHGRGSPFGRVNGCWVDYTRLAG